MGSFAETDNMDTSMQAGDDSMVGATYSTDHPSDQSGMTEEERRQQQQQQQQHMSLPSIKASSHGSGPGGPSSASDAFAGQSRTYPAAGSLERPHGILFPPLMPQERAAASNASSSGNASSMPVHGAGSALYSQTAGVTESPKPLSPAGQRSPSVTQQQYQQQHFGRRPSDRNASPGFLSSGQPGSSTAPAPHARTTSSGGTVDNASNMFTSDPGLWTYMQCLEDRVQQFTESVTSMQKADNAKQAQIGLLTTEMTALKKQLQNQEAEAASRQAQIGLLTAEVTELKKLLQQQQQQGRDSEGSAAARP
ncbi:hypothetical protein ACRALDRAFT_2042431 [Sodiomyces alcalophilus JCM 7366]|uniref:uncharacterized protein n=1 Tax=Sodiomyces alcalophilus JCM 7366 TaxID=591952 RepID=UPI0039B57192